MYLTLPRDPIATARPRGYRLDPSDPEYQRIRRDAASAFGDEPEAVDTPTPVQPAGDLGDQIVALMMAKRGKLPASPAPAPAPEGDLGDQIVALMRQKRGQK